MEETRFAKSSHHNGKDVNIIVVGMKGVGKSDGGRSIKISNINAASLRSLVMNDMAKRFHMHVNKMLIYLTLTVRFLTKRFIGDYDSQIDKWYTQQITMDGKSVTIHILDTAWQENGLEIKEEQIIGADAVVMVYSVTDKTSFEKLKEFANFVISHRTDKVVKALVANKCDLVHMRQVTDVDASQFCAEYNCMFFETSASENYNSVANAFTSVTRQVKLTMKKREKLSKFMQNPAVAAKLQIERSLRNLAEMKWRSRAPTM